MKVIALIPARGGSKGLKNKNMRLIKGKPMIQYTIEAAIKSDVFDKIIVSTDDKKIADFARKYKIDVDYPRPAELCKDDVPLLPVAKYIFDKEKEKPDYICILQPSNPLRDAEDIKNSFYLLSFFSLPKWFYSVCEVKEHPYRMRFMDGKHNLSPLWHWQSIFTRNIHNQRQYLPRIYKLNGAIIYIHRKILRKRYPDYPSYDAWSNPKGYIMSPRNSLDIDTLEDLKLARKLINEKRKKR